MLNIPKTLQAGDTITWTDFLSDFKASDGWVLKYTLVGSNTFTVTGTADGDNHSFTITAAQSTKYVAGDYTYFVSATNGADSRTIEKGSLEVLVDYRKIGNGYDPRTIAQRMVSLLEDLLEGRATKEYTELEVTGLIGKRITLTDMSAIRSEYFHWKRIRKDEITRENIAAGRPAGNKILMRVSSGL